MDISSQRVLSLLGAALLVMVGMYFWHIFHHGELPEAPYWAALQGVEYESRSAEDASLLLRSNIGGTGADAVGLRSQSSSYPRVWVILNETDSDGEPYVMPRGVPFAADCHQLERQISGRRVEPSVRSLLFRGCTEKR